MARYPRMRKGATDRKQPIFRVRGNPVLRILRIRMFWATTQVRILMSSNKKRKKNLDFYCFVTSLWLFICEEWCKCTSVPDPHPDSEDPYVFRPPGSVNQRYGSEDPDPYQNVTDAQHWGEQGKTTNNKLNDSSRWPITVLYHRRMLGRW